MLLAERLHVELMELPVAARLRPLVAEHRAHRVQLDGLGLHVEAVLDVRAQLGGRRLRTKGERIAPAILEGVHLLLHDVGDLADPAREELRALEDRQTDLAIAVRLEDPACRRLHVLPRRPLRQAGCHAPDGLDHRRDYQSGWKPARSYGTVS